MSRNHSAGSLAFGNNSADILGNNAAGSLAFADNSADILGFASGVGGLQRARGGRSTRPYRDFVARPSG